MKSNRIIRYATGEEVHIGDEVIHMGRPGTVVFVIDLDEFSAEFPRNVWKKYKRGFMIKDEFGLFKYEEIDPCIDFVRRGREAAQTSG